MKIAILPQGGDQWIAGIIYNHNLIRALHMLPGHERPELHFFVGPQEETAHHRELGGLCPPFNYYCCRRTHSNREKLQLGLQSMRRMRMPVSLEGLAERIKPEVIFPVQGCLGTHFPTPWISWIPDFQHKRLPEFFPQKELDKRDRHFSRVAAEAPYLVVSSKDAYDDLQKFFPASSEKVSVLTFHTVPDGQWYEENPAAVVRNLNLPDKFLIFPSQFWVHKNHRMVFEALFQLKQRGVRVPLVCTGATQDYRRPDHFSSLKEFISSRGLEADIHILGLLPRHQQVQLIRASAAIVQPSLFEGWSSLLEDARTLGKQVFVSDIPVHREQNPPHAAYFDPLNSHQLAGLIAEYWPRLQPGPDPAHERLAREQSAENAKSFARNFLAISRRASRNFKNSLQK